MIGDPVTLATFDRQLWEAAAKSGLIAWPEGGI
ncbi:MAG: type II toxin-antitoxin system VapC family toxin [Nitrospirales bacterium]|nr:type II toxin-antitoxin system VapC family toxin [Nitrospirales bacterium]